MENPDFSKSRGPLAWQYGAEEGFDICVSPSLHVRAPPHKLVLDLCSQVGIPSHPHFPPDRDEEVAGLEREDLGSSQGVST